jgi:hypothetical protein
MATPPFQPSAPLQRVVPRESVRSVGRLPGSSRWLSCTTLALFLLLLAGCGSPGLPTPPRPPIPEAVANLSAQQSGSAVIVTFSLPKITTNGPALPRTPDVEIYRSVQPLAGEPSIPATLLLTIDGTLVHNYLAEGAFRFRDALQDADFARYANSRVVYAARTSLSARHLSAPSNAASVQVFPPARPVASVSMNLTKTAIVLSWPAPTETVTGGPIPILAGYRVYRAEAAPDSVADATARPSQSKLIAPFSLLASVRDLHYSDSTFAFGHAYFYSVRTVVEYPAGLVESDDSPWATVIARDTFPPSAPQGLEAAAQPAAGQTPARVDLSWAINPEPDIAGYNIYRSDSAGGTMVRLNEALLPTPVFQDASVQPGGQYTYQVTAVSRVGLESLRGQQISVTIPPGSGGNQ